MSLNSKWSGTYDFLVIKYFMLYHKFNLLQICGQSLKETDFLNRNASDRFKRACVVNMGLWELKRIPLCQQIIFKTVDELRWFRLILDLERFMRESLREIDFRTKIHRTAIERVHLNTWEQHYGRKISKTSGDIWRLLHCRIPLKIR